MDFFFFFNDTATTEIYTLSLHDALGRAEAVSVNTVAPYVLTALMTKPARLVYLSSGMHRRGSTDLDRLARGTGSYSDRKLWVTALALALATRGDGTVRSSSEQPR